jgi:electron transfer flavoprotein beta subunit
VRILVCIKQVFAVDDEIVFTSDGLGVDSVCLEGSLNEWDAFAIEEGLRLREAHGGEVVAVTCGDRSAEDVLRRALAMGADRAVRIDAESGDPFEVGGSLAEVAKGVGADLVLCGAQSSDAAHAAVGTVIAGFLDLPCLAVARAIEVEPGAAEAVVTRELEGGTLDRVRLALPGVVTMQTGSNEPRYANLRAIKLAERAAIETVAPCSIRRAHRIRRLYQPPRESSARSLGTDVHEAATTIARVIEERLA